MVHSHPLQTRYDQREERGIALPSKSSRQIRSFCFSSIRLATLISSFTLAALAQFTFTAFDASPTTGITTPGGINNNGDIAGTFEVGSFSMGFIRDVTGNVTTFSLPQPASCNVAGNHPCINGINDLGQVVGTVYDAADNAFNFIRDQQGNISSLSAPPGVPLWDIVGLNNAGESIAESYITCTLVTCTSQLFLRTAAGTFYPLPLPPGLGTSFNFAGLNNNGEAAGSGTRSDGVQVGFVLDISSKQYTFFELPDQVDIVGGINDKGVIIGQTSGRAKTFIRSSDGSSVDSFYPVLPNENEGDTPTGINQIGTIVGYFGSGFHNEVVRRGYLAAPSKAAPPAISLLSVIAGPPQQAVFSVVDSTVGLFNIQTNETNSLVTISGFTPGQTTPVTVIATKVEQTQGATVEIIAENMVGDVNDFDPELITVYGTRGVKTEPLDVPSSEYVLTVTNSDPGLEALDIQVNGRAYVLTLKANETRTLNLKAWMTLNSNTLSFAGEGLADAQASVVLKDAVSGGVNRDSMRITSSRGYR